MNKTFVIIPIVIAIAAGVFIFSSFSDEPEPEIKDIVTEDIIELAETQIISENGVNYYLDENGNRVYVVEVEDIPDLGK